MLTSPRLALAAVAGACLAAVAGGAHAVDLQGTLYPGLGYDIVQIAPGQLAPVGYINPTMSYALPTSSTGGTASGDGVGLGSAQLSTGESFLGYRGIVMTPTGSYALGTLGANSVGGWTPAGFASSSAQAVNASGLIAGTSELYSTDGTQDLGGRAVYYAPGSATPTQLQLPTGFTDSSGFGIAASSNISSTGYIVGYAQQYNGDASVGTRALRWNTNTGTVEVLGKLPGTSQFGDNNSSPVAVNASGTTVGWGTTFTANGTLKGGTAIRWDANSTTPTELGHLGTASDRTYSSHAVAINDAGVTVGTSAKYSATHQALGDAAVRWDANSTTPVELHGLSGPGADGQSFNYAIAINNAGTIAGESQKFDASGVSLGNRAVRWAAGSTEATELGLLSQGSNGESFTYAFGMNSAGYVVGTANIVGTTDNSFMDPNNLGVHAVVWTPDGTAIDLNSLLPADSGWSLFSAYSISDTGWITGIGYYQPEGYSSDYAYQRLYSMQLTMAVPEPATAWMLGLGVVGLALAQRRRG